MKDGGQRERYEKESRWIEEKKRVILKLKVIEVRGYPNNHKHFEKKLFQ